MNNTIGFVLSAITLGINISTCLISLMIFIVITHHFCYNRLRQEDEITVINCINIYLIISICTVITVSFNIQTVLGDLYEREFNSSWCVFLGYFSLVLLAVMYWSFVNQVIS
jgi:hypothetical protein